MVLTTVSEFVGLDGTTPAVLKPPIPYPAPVCAPQNRISEEAGPPGITTPVVHEDHPKNMFVGFGNGDWLSESVPRAYKESLPWEKLVRI